MGWLGNKVNQAAEAGKQKVKTAAKNQVKKAVLGTADEIICHHCGRSRSRVQVQIHGSKHRKPLLFTCRNFQDCQKAREKNARGGSVRITRKVSKQLKGGGGLEG